MLLLVKEQARQKDCLKYKKRFREKDLQSIKMHQCRIPYTLLKIFLVIKEK